MKILLVDDDEAILDIVSDLLKDKGYQVSTACDGFKAKTQIALYKPDLIISDIKMTPVKKSYACN